MVGALVLLVLATAGFSAAVVLLRSRRTRPDPVNPRPDTPDAVGRGLDREQIQGFVFVGSAALAVLGVGVAVVGWAVHQPGPAEAMAVLGLMAYLLYLVIATVLIRRTARGRPRRSYELP